MSVGGVMRTNSCIVQILEQAGSSSPILVHKLLKELPQQDKEVKLDRWRHSAVPENIGGKLHYDQDGAVVLSKAENWASLNYNGNHISIYSLITPLMSPRSERHSQMSGKHSRDGKKSVMGWSTQLSFRLHVIGAGILPGCAQGNELC